MLRVELEALKKCLPLYPIDFSFQEPCRMNFLLIARTILFVDYVDRSADSCLTSDIHTLLSSSDRSIHDVSPLCNSDNIAASSRCSNDRRQQQSAIIRRCSVKCNMLKRSVVALSDLGLRKLFSQSRPC